MYGDNFRAPKVDIHSFSMVPRTDIPRSAFRMEHQHKTTINASFLYPVYLQEVLPGDSFNVRCAIFARLATPLYPIMDNMDLEIFFFFVPNRLVWVHWPNFCGEQNNPSDSIAYSIPIVQSPPGGFARFSLYDYFGLPCAGQTTGVNVISVNALPLRAYNLIFQEWFRDENLVGGVPTGSGGALPAGAKFMCVSDDGPDPNGSYVLRTAAKRHDYFTACLPWTQKGGVAVTLPLSGSATVKTNASNLVTGAQNPMNILGAAAGASPPAIDTLVVSASGVAGYSNTTQSSAVGGFYPSNLYADLTTATASTINAIRLAFQTQRLLERDARGGTRYTEIVRSHFGVVSPDARLMRPEYLGGGKVPLNVAPVPQTTATGLTGGSSPLGTLAAVGTAHSSGIGFRQSFTEHGHILGLVVARRDQVYQQGIRRLWSRSTRYDYPWPVFAHIGEQAVLNQEIYSDGSANDLLVFGFQERYAEMRHHPSFTTGYFNSRATTPLDAWHLAENYASVPFLNGAFIADETNVVLQRNLAAGNNANNQQLLCDFYFEEKVARPLPAYGVPGMIDHF